MGADVPDPRPVQQDREGARLRLAPSAEGIDRFTQGDPTGSPYSFVAAR
jgi:hypothetical protein